VVRWEKNKRIAAGLKKLGIATKYAQDVEISLRLDACPVVRVQVVAIDTDAIAEMIDALNESEKVELHLTVAEWPQREK